MLKYAFGINMANTEFLNRKLIDEIAALGMPYPEEVIINHGAALVIRGVRPVSYTHLDVYKRQMHSLSSHRCQRPHK